MKPSNKDNYRHIRYVHACVSAEPSWICYVVTNSYAHYYELKFKIYAYTAENSGVLFITSAKNFGNLYKQAHSRERNESKFVGFVVGTGVQSCGLWSSEMWCSVSAQEIPDASRESVALIFKVSRRMKATLSLEAMRITYPPMQRHFSGAQYGKTILLLATFKSSIYEILLMFLFV